MNLAFFIQLVIWELAVGLLSTAVMTAAQYIEIAIKKRPSSTTPGQAAAKIFGIPFETFSAKNQLRFSNKIHWLYGIVWGVPLIFLSVFFDITNFFTNFILYFLIIWIQGFITFYLLGVAPLPWNWERYYIILEIIMKSIYALVAAGFYIFAAQYFMII